MGTPAAGAFLETTTCPSTTFQWTMQDDAAGTPVWVPQEPMSLPADQCTEACPVGKSGMVKSFRMCGPGTFTLSRMSCAQHDYKAVTIEHSNKVFTATKCQEYNTADFYQIDGRIGSVKVTC